MKVDKRYILYLFVAFAMVISILGMMKLYSESEYSQLTNKNSKITSTIMQNITLKNIPQGESLPPPPNSDTDSRPRTSQSIKSTAASEPAANTGTSSGSGSGSSGGGGSSSNPAPAPITPPVDKVAPATPNTPTNTQQSGDVCNPALFTNDNLDSSRIMNVESCNLLNSLYRSGNAAGNADDLYYNLDNKHINFCVDWTPNPDCPIGNRLFTQHDWKFSDQGRVTQPLDAITVGQASYAGTGDHGIAYVYYQNQQNAEEAYRLYTNNNLYVYPSLDDDAFQGDKASLETLTNPTINIFKANIANTPYIISSKQITKPGTDYYMVHEASGSELPFVKLSFVALAALKPEVKQRLSERTSAQEATATFLIPTIQMLIRYSHKSINNNDDYLTSGKIHRGAYLAHTFDGAPQPAYDSTKLVNMANSLTINDIPPLVQLQVVSENFEPEEKLFDTPGAIARTVPHNTLRTISVNAQNSFDIQGSGADMEYIWKTPDNTKANIITNLNNPAEATIEFFPQSETQRVDVFVFVKKKDGKYYSVPGVISNYIHS